MESKRKKVEFHNPWPDWADSEEGKRCREWGSERKMEEVKELIQFYESRGKNWIMAAEYVLGQDDSRRHWLNDYYLRPRSTQ